MVLVPHTGQPDSKLPFVVTDRTWAIADTHFNHVNIAEYEAIRQTLGRDHNVVMVQRWRELVSENDVVVHFGDLALGRNDDFERIAEQLPGRKYIVKGNHDRRSRAWYARHGFTVIPAFWLDHRGWAVRCQHYPDYERAFTSRPNTLVAHGHVHSKTLGDRRNLNLSVEVTDFRPVRLLAALDARIDELTA